jgi:hypothetical protein
LPVANLAKWAATRASRATFLFSYAVFSISGWNCKPSYAWPSLHKQKTIPQ